MRPRALAWLLLLCLPSALYAWLFRDMPHFGVLEDDSIYYAGAKALAQGTYRILTLPGEPFQTKYPPLYPLYLSLAWRVMPEYPANLSLAIWLHWLSVPTTLALLLKQFKSRSRTWALLVMLAVSPFVLFFSVNFGSELPFLALVLCAFAAQERPWLAGLLAGLAYLARTAGVALLPAGIVFYLLARRPKAAVWFSLAMLPAMIGWNLWVRTHAAPGQDIVTLYYTNYVGYQFYNVTWDNCLLVFSTNADALLLAMSNYILPESLTGVAARAAGYPIAIVMIAGIWRLAREGTAVFYACFCAFSAVMLVLWHFPPNPRFILPFVPLLLLGFLHEGQRLLNWQRRAVSGAGLAALGAKAAAVAAMLILMAGALLQIAQGAYVVPGLFAKDREYIAGSRSAYRWIADHLPADANILWEHDAVLGLATNRHAAALLIPVSQWYKEGFDGDEKFWAKMVPYAREHKLGYVLLPKIGLHASSAVLAIAAQSPDLENIHEEPATVLYRVKSPQ